MEAQSAGFPAQCASIVAWSCATLLGQHFTLLGQFVLFCLLPFVYQTVMLLPSLCSSMCEQKAYRAERSEVVCVGLSCEVCPCRTGNLTFVAASQLSIPYQDQLQHEESSRGNQGNSSMKVLQQTLPGPQRSTFWYFG